MNPLGDMEVTFRDVVMAREEGLVKRIDQYQREFAAAWAEAFKLAEKADRTYPERQGRTSGEVR